jgi:predicted DCC family thiol-disulfide oxidoreductase YuxK
VSAEITDKRVEAAGWLFYDGECDSCRAAARRFGRILPRRNFALRPLQSPGAAERLGLDDRDLLREVRLLLADGRSLGGADAVVEIARHIWWGWPLWLMSRFPGARPILRAAYHRIAANRHCVAGVCLTSKRLAAITLRVGSTERSEPRSAILLQPIIALLKVFKRLWFAGGTQTANTRESHSTPPQPNRPRHRHSAFFELP